VIGKCTSGENQIICRTQFRRECCEEAESRGEVVRAKLTRT